MLDKYGMQYVSFGKNYLSVRKKIFGLMKFTILLLKLSLKINPDMYISHGSFYAAIVSKIRGKPHISLENNGNWEQIRIYLPFTDVVITPMSLKENLGKKQIRVKTFHEMAYLRPKYFSPDRSLSLIHISEPKRPY